ncbi:MAG TPA: hypothetical protein VGH44_03290 [Candidatus Saccharimonadia bacterium]|jgi:uncharacterized membrane-anchored protein
MKQNMLRKVPQVTAIFWVVKLLTTAFGESTTDYLVKIIDPVIAVILGAIVLGVSLFIQFRARKYIPWVYWFAVVMVAVFGTMAADVTHLVLGVPYLYSTAFFLISLGVVFALWYKFERTLSIHSIVTTRREFFYWATVLATFALGTAAGDFAAITLHLGFLVAGLVFTAVIALPAVAYWGFGLNEVAAFWFAYILTRPVGASFADWFGKSASLGGLGYGDGIVSLVLGVLITALVAYLQITHSDVERGRAKHSF